MSIAREHDLHKRRKSRNVGLGLTLAAFIMIVFGMTMVKVSRGDFDMRPDANSTLVDIETGKPVEATPRVSQQSEAADGN
ncbi:hypothetical protein [Sagittula salina]|uniref:Cytochrome C oxidase assembly protein n=1 Tax=Sagittula salina TaxID=2820268 RepID=A0A940RZP0_9RHOB|nr:hypothetical protein [Sagittula salina]MBP0481326.1 hypothetical protein [Sagittula salina]